MNLTNFLKQTKSIASQYSAAQLAAFIQDIGRTLPEYSREDFLKRLKAAGNLTEKAAASKEADTSGFQEMYLLVRENLKTIDSQEIALSSSVNTDYDYDSYNDWYDEEEEFCYEDNEGITDMLEEACTFIHTCMDREAIGRAMKLAARCFPWRSYASMNMKTKSCRLPNWRIAGFYSAI